MPRNRSTRRRSTIGLLIALVTVAAGLWGADSLLKRKRHPGLATLVRQLFTNYPAAFEVEPITLAIAVEEDDMDRLRRTVEEARARGVILPEGREEVPAVLRGPEGEFKARIRIKGKMTDHVKGDKWSFRVVAKKDGRFLGMRRFSLQHPGTRSYVNEWFFHRLCAGEDLIALKYGFIRVLLNGDDLGIYAYEEHFGPELLEHNARVKGPLFRFDPSLYWEHRLNERNKLRYDEPFAAYQAAAIDAFEGGALAKDPEALVRFEEAIALLEAFRRGELMASQVFDADKLALRHALLDLVGGHHSMDFSDVKFYYDPVAQRIEPVSYESFSAFPIRTLAGSHRYTGRHDPAADLHDQYFNDPQVFRRYVHHLERISRKSWLDSVFTALGPALDSARRIVHREFPWKDIDRDIFLRNQRTIRKLLDVPKGFHAHRQERSADTLLVMAVPIEGLPLEVRALVLPDGTTAPPIGEAIVPVRPRNVPGTPVELRFLVPAKVELRPQDELRIGYSVLGASVVKELEVFPQALLDPAELRPVWLSRAMDARSLPFIAAEVDTRTLHLLPGTWSIAQDVVVPEGWTLRGTSPLRIELRDGARIECRGAVHLVGLPDAPIAISVNGGGGIFLIDASEPNVMRHVRLVGEGSNGSALLTVHGGGMELEHVHLQNDSTGTLLQLVRSKARLKNVVLAGGRDQLVAAFSSVRSNGLESRRAGDDALVLRGGHAELRRVDVVHAQGSGIKAAAGAVVELDTPSIQARKRAVEVQEGAQVSVRGGRLASDDTGVHVHDRVAHRPPAVVRLHQVRIDALLPVKEGTGNTVERIGTKPTER